MRLRRSLFPPAAQLPPIQGLEDSVFNEFFCMQLARACGLPAPETHILWIAGKPYDLVARYDRQSDASGSVRRLDQEDFCQAMHVAPEIETVLLTFYGYNWV